MLAKDIRALLPTLLFEAPHEYMLHLCLNLTTDVSTQQVYGHWSQADVWSLGVVRRPSLVLPVASRQDAQSFTD